MLKNSITPRDVCDLLNELLKIDYNAIYDLVSTHFACNEKVANHPTVQVRAHNDYKEYTLSLFGFLNGLFGIRDDGFGSICYIISKDNDKITGFKLTPENLNK